MNQSFSTNSVLEPVNESGSLRLDSLAGTEPLGRRDAAAVLLILLLAAAPAALVLLAGGAFLPRHPGTLDVPWAAAEDAARHAAEPVNHALSDPVNLLLPDQVFNRKELLGGRLPLWNPGILGGVPHAANPLAAVFYPPNWLLLPFDPVDARLLGAALHVALAGIFLFIFLRFAGLGRPAAVFGGVAFAFSGWVAAHLQNTPIVAVAAWIPLGLAALERRFRGGGPWSLVPLALSVAMMGLAGFPQLAVYGTVALALYALAGLAGRIRRDGARRTAALGGSVLLFAALGLLLASLQVLPVIEVMGTSGHHGRTAGDLVDERFRGGGWLGLALPGLAGSPMDAGDWKSHWGARLAFGEGPEALPPPVMNWSERTIYPGLIVLALAGCGLSLVRQRAFGTMALLGAAGALLAAAAPVVRATAGIPGFDVGAPARAVVLVALALPCLAALALDRILRRRTDGILARRWPGPVIAGLAAAVLLLAGAAFVFEDGLLETSISGLQDLGVEARFGVPERRPASDYAEAFRPAFRDLRADLVRLGFVFLGGAAALVLLRAARPRLAGAAFAAAVLGDLLAFLGPVNRPVTREGLFTETPGMLWLADHLGDHRFMRVSASPGEARADVGRLWAPNLPLIHGQADAQGYREQVPQDYLELWKGVAAATRPVGISGIAADQAGSPVLDLTGVRYLVAARPVDALLARQVYPAAGARAEMWIYENADVLDRAFVVHGARRLAGDEARVAIRSGAVDLRGEVLLEEEPGPVPDSHPDAPATDNVEIESEAPGEIVLRVGAKAHGHLVLADTWYPGWRAEITPVLNGSPDPSGWRSVPLLRGDTCFRAVPLGGGTWRVRLRYEPSWFWPGAGLSLGALVLLLLLPCFLGRTRPAAA